MDTRKTYKWWTTREEQELTLMVEDGSTAHEIAHVLGRTWASCRGKINQLGLHSPRPTGRVPNTDRDITVLDLVNKGYNLAEIGRMTDIPRATVWESVQRFVRLGVVVRSGGGAQSCRYTVAKWWIQASPKLSNRYQKKWEEVAGVLVPLRR